MAMISLIGGSASSILDSTGSPMHFETIFRRPGNICKVKF